MKKFIKTLLGLILIVGALAAYFFFANGKMMISVVKQDKDALSTTINNAIQKVHDYGNYNFSYSAKFGETTYSADILIKYDGDKSYFTAETSSVVGETTTNKSYYCETTGAGVATLFVKNGDSTKNVSVTTWDLAIGQIFGGNTPDIVTKILNKDGEIPKDTFVNNFASSKVIASFKPFYYGAQISIENSVNSRVYDISNRGIIRKATDTFEVLGVKYETTVIINKPGKDVKITQLTNEQKAEYVSL